MVSTLDDPGLATIKLLATDLDGTLLRPDGSVSLRTVASLALARANGLPVVFVTGRPPRWLPDVVAATDHAGPVVCANGALLVDVSLDGRVELMHRETLAAAALSETVTRLRTRFPGIGFAVERGFPDAGLVEFGVESHYVARWPMPDTPRGDVLELAEGGGVIKLLARLPAGSAYDADTFVTGAHDAVADLVEVTHSNSADVLLEMSALGVTKASMLARYATTLGIAAPLVAACGDMPNDVPMLAWAGFAYAIEGGHPHAQAVGRPLPRPELDGIAQLLDAIASRST